MRAEKRADKEVSVIRKLLPGKAILCKLFDAITVRARGVKHFPPP